MAAQAVTLGPDLIDKPWADSDGQAWSLRQVRAPITVMTMAYTGCKKVCNTTGLVLTELQNRLDTLGLPAEFVVVSYDPSNDSPAAWRDYRERRGLTQPNWHFLSGDARSTQLLSRYLALDFWSYHEHIVHDFRIVLFDRHWREVAALDWAHAHALDEVLLAAKSASQRPAPPGLPAP